MNLDDVTKEIDDLREKFQNTKLTTQSLLKLVPEFRLDWSDDVIDLANEYNIGATKPILLSGFANSESKIKLNALLFESNSIAKQLNQLFISERKISMGDLLNLHGLIFRNGGTLRTHNVTVETRRGQEQTPFANYEDIQPQLIALIEWLNFQWNNPQDHHPLFIIGIFHYNLVRIHPFEDGNGRFARIISSMLFLSFGLPPISMRYSDRFSYLDSLRYADNGDIKPLLNFLGDGVIGSLRLILSETTLPDE